MAAEQEQTTQPQEEKPARTPPPIPPARQDPGQEVREVGPKIIAKPAPSKIETE
jgi:hypothetical protein